MRGAKRSALLAASATITAVIFFSGVRAQPEKYYGKWRTPENDIVEFVKKGTHLTATFVSGGDCPFGEKRTTYFEAEFAGQSCDLLNDCKDVLKGSMERCTNSEELFRICNLPAVYTAYFEATITPAIVDISWKNQHYSEMTDDKNKDGSAKQAPNNGDKKTCRWERDPSGDKKLEFKLFRETTRSGHKCLGRRCI